MEPKTVNNEQFKNNPFFKKPTQVTNEETTEVIETKVFPFVLVRKNKIYRIAAGDAFMSKKVFKTKFGALLYLHARPTELLVNFICKTIQISKQQ